MCFWTSDFCSKQEKQSGSPGSQLNPGCCISARSSTFFLPGCNLLIMETLTHNLNCSFAVALSSH